MMFHTKNLHHWNAFAQQPMFCPDTACCLCRMALGDFLTLFEHTAVHLQQHWPVCSLNMLRTAQSTTEALLNCFDSKCSVTVITGSKSRFQSATDTSDCVMVVKGTIYF